MNRSGFQAAEHVNGRVLWANLHLLVWLSLIPFVTSWMGNEFEPTPVALYGVVLLLAGFAYRLVVLSLPAVHGQDSRRAIAIRGDFKGISSLMIYALAIPLSSVSVWISAALYVLVALIWFIPDMRIEKTLTG